MYCLYFQPIRLQLRRYHCGYLWNRKLGKMSIDSIQAPGEADNYVEHPTSDGEQKKETKKRKSKTAKQAPPVEEMKDFFQQEFNKIWDSLNHVQKAIADLPKNTNTAQMSATIKVSAENKSQASTCDKQEEKTAEGK